jgi:glycine/D-amino acid oxidase-like deaminating enzyme
MTLPVDHCGLWAETAQSNQAIPSLRGALSCDVAVVGAGYTGLSAALTLCEQGASVCVLEAHHAGHGGSGRNVGLVNAGLWLAPDEIIKRIGGEQGERLIEVLGAAPARVFATIAKHAIACEAQQQGTLHCAHSAAGLRDLERRQVQWGQRGVTLSLLDAAQTQTATGASGYHGALLDLRAGTIQPLAYAQGLAAAAQRSGAKIYEKSPVIRISKGADGFHLETAEGRVSAGAVILATNVYAEQGAKGHYLAMPSFGYFQCATPPLPPEQAASVLPQNQGAWDTHAVLTSFRKDAQGRLILGSVGRLDYAGRAVHSKWAQRVYIRLFPQLPFRGFEHEWFGRIGVTGDSIPRFAELAPGMLTVWGYNGRGIGPGTVFGDLLARALLTGDRTKIPLSNGAGRASLFRLPHSCGVEVGARAFHFISARGGAFRKAGQGGPPAEK